MEAQENGVDVSDVESVAAGSEVLDENGNPFWMKFFKQDYLGETSTVK